MMSARTGRWMVIAAASMLLGGALIGCGGLDRGHARHYYETKQYDEAETRFERLVARDLTDWESRYYLGMIRLHQNRPLDAEILLEQAHRLRHDHPETPMILDGLAEAMLRQDRTAALAAMLEEATRYHGTSKDFVRQAVYLGRSGDADGAAAAFRRAAAVADPGDPSPFLAAADYYESIGDDPRAVTALRNALYVRKNDPFIGARLRKHGVIPGPAAELEPVRE